MELIYKKLRARMLLAAKSAGQKYLPLCLACFVCLGLQVSSTVEAAPKASPEAASEASSGTPGSGPVASPTAGQEAAVSGSPVEVRELWTGSLYSSTYRVGVCFSADGKVRGVVHLRLYNGKVDVYHIDGTVQNNDIEAHHSSGHKFKGRLVSADKVEGVISLKNGMNIKLEGKRAHDVELVPEDCAPLPQ